MATEVRAMTRGRISMGRWGESLAADYLRRQGYAVLDRNVRTPYGEIDLVTQHLGVVVFVEVKTRQSSGFGWPEQAVTPKKQARLVAAAEAYLENHPQLVGDWRIDVIAILRDPVGGQPVITHFDHAIP